VTDTHPNAYSRAAWGLRRRLVLAEVLEKFDVLEVAFSPAVIGAGTAFYDRVVAAGQEGVMAKLLASGYRPVAGTASRDWTRLGERMRYIVNLFRALHLHSDVVTAPYTPNQFELIRGAGWRSGE
jgi:hypothetical protein